MKTKFVCGAQIERKGGTRYAIFPMCQVDTVEEAVIKNAALHLSFGYAIYEVEDREVPGILSTQGVSRGKHWGLPVIRKVCQAYDHPAWPGRTK